VDVARGHLPTVISSVPLCLYLLKRNIIFLHKRYWNFSNKQLELLWRQLIISYSVEVDNKKSCCRNFLFYFSRANKVTATHFTDPLILNTTTNQIQGMCWSSQKRQEDCLLLKNECFLQAALYFYRGDTDDITAQHEWMSHSRYFFTFLPPNQIIVQKLLCYRHLRIQSLLGKTIKKSSSQQNACIAN